MALKEWVSLGEVASHFGLGEATVQDWLRDRKITGERIGGEWRIDPYSVNAFKAEMVQQYGIPDFSAANMAGINTLTVGELGKAFGVSGSQVERWIFEGTLQTRPRTKDTKGKLDPALISVSEANKFKQGMVAMFGKPDMAPTGGQADIPAETGPGMGVWEVADELGLSGAQVVEHIESDELVGRKVEGEWRIESRAVEEFKASKRQMYDVPDFLPELISPEGNIDYGDAADILGISKGEVVRKLYTGELEGEKVGSKWQVSLESLNQYKNTKLGERVAASPFEMPVMEITEENVATADLWLYGAEPDRDWMSGKEYVQQVYGGSGEGMASTFLYDVNKGLVEAEYIGEDKTYTGRQNLENWRVSEKAATKYRQKFKIALSMRPEEIDAPTRLQKQYVTTSEVGQKLGVSTAQVRDWVSKGRLQGEKIGTKWRVSIESANVLMGDLAQEVFDTYAFQDIAPEPAYYKTTISGDVLEELWGIKESDITRMVATGTLTGTRGDKGWSLDIESVNKYKRAMIGKWADAPWLRMRDLTNTEGLGFTVGNL